MSRREFQKLKRSVFIYFQGIVGGEKAKCRAINFSVLGKACSKIFN